ncbi:hypothetical protein OK074_1727 [Actinobacteria bacterium OK074]|nr:hypothetical protein OK074_1727 [Actinobacteria bacterium OK074]
MGNSPINRDSGLEWRTARTPTPARIRVVTPAFPFPISPVPPLPLPRPFPYVERASPVMRHSSGPLLRRALLCACALSALCAPGTPATAAAPPPVTPAAAPLAAEADQVPFARRYGAVRHGGIVRAANTSITCRTTAPGCSSAQDGKVVRGGRAAANGDFDMFYVDVDSDPNTYNSSRAEVRVPQGAHVSYARLYWGGNLRVGEQKPPKDNGRVLVAEPGGQYKAVLADSVVGHRTAFGADAYQASADVTRLVRDSGSGLYTVAQVNVAMGRSAAGAWGGWTLVVAYEHPDEPLRHLELWDGFDALAPPGGRTERPFVKPGAPGEFLLRLHDLTIPQTAHGTVGLIAYNGDRDRTGDSLTVTAGRGPATALADAANPRDDVLNSTISEPASTTRAQRTPSYTNTLGYDSDVFDLDRAVRGGGDQLALRLVSHRDAAWIGALFVAVDAKQ